MRTSAVLCAVVLASVSVFASSQEPKPPKDENAITVTGCIDKGWLRVHVSDAAGSFREQYRLRGSKQLLKEMASKYHKHLLEVTGIVTDYGDTMHKGKTIQLGKKTRITTGAKEVPDVPPVQDPTLEVRSFRELKDTCR